MLPRGSLVASTCVPGLFLRAPARGARRSEGASSSSSAASVSSSSLESHMPASSSSSKAQSHLVASSTTAQSCAVSLMRARAIMPSHAASVSSTTSAALAEAPWEMRSRPRACARAGSGRVDADWDCSASRSTHACTHSRAATEALAERATSAAALAASPSSSTSDAPSSAAGCPLEATAESLSAWGGGAASRALASHCASLSTPASVSVAAPFSTSPLS
mmetsp:Transcript_20364/g.60077  ORF Transcript_20364/g.60077 Transcript_20364/m.60077 type:complete len:220 (-) Transcript_20364:810-1469(-)